MWIWSDGKGQLTNEAGAIIGVGYSGLGAGKDNDNDVKEIGVGPIPWGMWDIVNLIDSPETGPCTLVLQPQEGTDTWGRSAFRIHGDSITDPGNASHGCIVLPRIVRTEIWASNDHVLHVVE